LYGLFSLFTTARSSEFQRLQVKDDFDIICGIEKLGCVAKRLIWEIPDQFMDRVIYEKVLPRK
jgi:hypothetical protein